MGYQSVAALARGFREFLQEGGFQVVRVDVDFAGGDFGVAGALVAQFANAEGLGAAAYRRAEGAAGDRAGGIELAQAGFRVKRGTGLVIGISGGADALAEAGGPLGIARFQFGKAQPQPAGVELGDGKRPEAALGAAWAADQPRPALARGLGQRGIHDPKEGLVSRIDPVEERHC